MHCCCYWTILFTTMNQWNSTNKFPSNISNSLLHATHRIQSTETTLVPQRYLDSPMCSFRRISSTQHIGNIWLNSLVQRDLGQLIIYFVSLFYSSKRGSGFYATLRCLPISTLWRTNGALFLRFVRLAPFMFCNEVRYSYFLFQH